MNVNRNEDDTFNIVVTENEAGLLLSVLAGVSDLTTGESLDRLYNLLLDRSVVPTGHVTIEENPLSDEEENEPAFNVVVED